jgi:hypothetical protein
MEMVLAVIMSAVIIAMIVVVEIYFGMDKLKARAIVLVGRMQEYLDVWVTLATDLGAYPGADQKSAETLRTLAESYFGCKKYKDRLKKIALVNKMAALAGQRSAGGAPKNFRQERPESSASLEPLRATYNQCVRILNKRLDKKIQAAVGKLFKVGRLEELSDLTRV